MIKCPALSTLLEEAGVDAVNLMVARVNRAGCAALEGLDKAHVQVKLAAVDVEQRACREEEERWRVLLEREYAFRTAWEEMSSGQAIRY